jgi:hypothetical protein
MHYHIRYFLVYVFTDGKTGGFRAIGSTLAIDESFGSAFVLFRNKWQSYYFPSERKIV